jgi:hypothetical protein
LITALDFAELLANIRKRDGLIADFGDDVGIVRVGAGARTLRHEVQQHADADEADENPDEDFHQDLLVVQSSSHP